MRKLLYINCLAIMLLAFGCEKMPLEAPDFEVSLQPGTYKVGDSVRFILSGNADLVAFYSGRPNNNYDLITPKVLPNKINLSFDSRTDNAGQTDQLQILTSTNFSGTNTLDALKAATWQNINNKFTFPGVGIAFAPSGVADITSQIKNGSPFYIAVKYAVKPVGEAGAWAKWELNNFNFKSVNEQEEKTPLDLNQSTSWTAVLSSNYETSRVSLGTNGLVLQGNATNTSEAHEAWVVSKVTYPYTSTTYKPDTAIAIKSVPQPALTRYATAYTAPGTYQAVFVAKNIKKDKEKTVVKKISVTIQP